MKKLRIREQDYLKAHRKASREEELARHGRPTACRAVHKSKKTYDRKREKAGLRNLPFSFPGRRTNPQDGKAGGAEGSEGSGRYG